MIRYPDLSTKGHKLVPLRKLHNAFAVPVTPAIFLIYSVLTVSYAR